MAHPGNLPTGKHYTTTHSPSGSSIFLPTTTLSEIPHFKPIPFAPSTFADLHVTPSIPVCLSPTSTPTSDPRNEEHDIPATAKFIEQNEHAAAVPQTGAVFRKVDMPPGASTPMHRTISVDFAVLLEGEVELILEGSSVGEGGSQVEGGNRGEGEKRILKASDTIVQRGTMHAWRNVGEGWARMVFVMMAARELEVGGVVLKEEVRLP